MKSITILCSQYLSILCEVHWVKCFRGYEVIKEDTTELQSDESAEHFEGSHDAAHITFQFEQLEIDVLVSALSYKATGCT